MTPVERAEREVSWREKMLINYVRDIVATMSGRLEIMPSDVEELRRLTEALDVAKKHLRDARSKATRAKKARK